jgi:hypothetical protein
MTRLAGGTNFLASRVVRVREQCPAVSSCQALVPERD